VERGLFQAGIAVAWVAKSSGSMDWT